MKKSIDLQVDKKSWAKGKPPKALTAMVGKRSLDVGASLLNLALRTRPPGTVGLQLADYWAWLRYFPAVAGTTGLSLRDQWDDIDPHQKTILSDEWGVGVTTGVLGQLLGVVAWADTHHLIKICGASLGSLTSKNKTGPKKSPDFVGANLSFDFLALECKGTQSGRSYLRRQLKDGVAQKRSLKFAKGVKSLGTYVGGLFVPLESGSEGALLRFRDPEGDEPVELPQSPERLLAAVVQSELASHLQLAGFFDLAETFEQSLVARPALVGTRQGSDGRPPDPLTVREIDGREWWGLAHRQPLRWPLSARDKAPTAAKVFIGFDRDRLEKLTKAKYVTDACDVLLDLLRSDGDGAHDFVVRQGDADEYWATMDDTPPWQDRLTLDTRLGVRVELDWVR